MRCYLSHLNLDTIVHLAGAMARIFVTGVNGHVGNNIVRDMLENGYEVKGSVRDISDLTKTSHVLKHAEDLGCQNRLELVEGDVLDKQWAEKLKGCDSLFHTATVYSMDGSAQTILDTANRGTMNLLYAAAEVGIKRVIYTSSVAAVGSTPKGVLKDDSFWNENFSVPYVQAKTESEHQAWKLAKKLDLDLRVINPSAVLGGNFERSTPSTSIIGDALAGKFPLAPKFPLAFVHVKDVAIAHRRAYEVDEANGRYLLTPHQNTNIHELLKRTKELYPKSKAPKRSMPMWMLPLAVFQDWFAGLFTGKRLLTRAAAKGFKKGDSLYSCEKAEKELGIEWTSFDQCIIDTVEGFE